MDLKQAEILANNLIRQFLPNMNWQFKWSNAKTILGKCSYSQKTIYLSKPITELNEENEIKDTILHEIAHVMVGRIVGTGSHGERWKRMAIIMGCNPKSCCGSNVKIPDYKYTYECPVCKKEYSSYYRYTQKRRSCSSCDSEKYNPKYTLQLVPK